MNHLFKPAALPPRGCFCIAGAGRLVPEDDLPLWRGPRESGRRLRSGRTSDAAVETELSRWAWRGPEAGCSTLLVRFLAIGVLCRRTFLRCSLSRASLFVTTFAQLALELLLSGRELGHVLMANVLGPEAQSACTSRSDDPLKWQPRAC